MSGNLKKGVLLMLGSSLCACVGQLLWKLSVINGIAYVLIGFFLYGIGALLMIVAYKYGKVSVLQPVLSVSYVLSSVLGIAVLGEIITSSKIIGISFIIVGVVLITGSDIERIREKETIQ